MCEIGLGFAGRAEAARAAVGLVERIRLCKLRRQKRQDHELGDAVAGRDGAHFVRVAVQRDGALTAVSGVEHADAARAEQAVLKELADLCDGPITDEELEDCRRGLLAGMNGLEDTLGGIETWYYMEVLRGGPVQTPDDARRALLAVTREDVRDILKQFTLSVSCLLTREEGNGNG